jgi:hypothetical protein
MTCQRCDGLMVPHRFADVSPDREQLYSEGWRCVNCGEAVDLLVMENRLGQTEPVTPSRRRWSRKVAA